MKVATVVLAFGLAAVGPAVAESYECLFESFCEADSCHNVEMRMVLTIDDGGATLSEAGDDLKFVAAPMQEARLRAFVAEDGMDVVFITLGEDLSIVMTAHMPNSPLRYVAATGNCREAI
jgi:hypothetical protein